MRPSIQEQDRREYAEQLQREQHAHERANALGKHLSSALNVESKRNADLREEYDKFTAPLHDAEEEKADLEAKSKGLQVQLSQANISLEAKRRLEVELQETQTALEQNNKNCAFAPSPLTPVNLCPLWGPFSTFIICYPVADRGKIVADGGR